MRQAGVRGAGLFRECTTGVWDFPPEAAEIDMVFAWSKPRYSPIAIDFGTDSLKVLQVIPGDSPKLLAASAATVPEVSRADPAARHAFHADALRDILRTQPFKGKRVICSLPSCQTLVQHFEVNRTDKSAEMDAQVDLHLRQRFNVDPSRMVVRSFPIESAGTGPKQEIICVAASRDVVMRHISIAHRAKLDVVGMHCEPLAILKAFAHLYRRADDQRRITCFLDLGASTTKVVIARGIQMVFAKTIHAAGDHFTRQFAQTGGVSFEVARRMRWHSATERPGASASDAATVVSDDQAAVAVADPPAAEGGFDQQAFGGDAMDCLIDELQLCFRHFTNRWPGEPVEKIVFLGGESRRLELCQRIAQSVRIAAQLGDPLARLARSAPPDSAGMGIDLREPQPGWAVPMGLCLSEANL